MRRTVQFLLFVVLAFGILFGTPAVMMISAQSVTPPPTATDQAIENALTIALSQGVPHAIGTPNGTNEIDHIEYSQDGLTAIVWLAFRDAQTGQILESEPAPAIAHNTGSKVPGTAGWVVLLQSSSNWQSSLEALPADLLSDVLKNEYMNGQKAMAPSASEVFRGYKLPYAAGLSKRMTNSLGHYLSVAGGFASCPSTCQFAFDFADGTHFPILAAKGGVTRYSYDACANDNHNCTNYLVLEDASTVPTTFQIYFHLAYRSIPSNVKNAGSLVVQGQYVGDADNTGNSTGSHLHYHVTKSIYFYSSNGQSLPWGYSADIRFDDVAINDGRPRMCSESSQYPNLGAQCNANNQYVSGNQGANPPSGTLSVPFPWTNLASRTLDVSGTATDNLQVTRVQVLLNFNGAWQSVADADYANGIFAKSVDVCSLGIPDGPMSLAVRIWDREGNRAAEYTGMRQVFKNFSCSGNSNPPPPVCQPGTNEVSLYANANFQGACQKFGAGTYPSTSFGSVGDNNAASIQVGANVHAVLYDLGSDLTASPPTGRIESFTSDLSNLANQRIGSDIASALWVQTAADQQDASAIEPFLTSPGNLGSSSPKSTDSLVLSWYGSQGGTSFTSNLQKPVGTVILSMPEQNTNTWPVGNLPAGQYRWTVTAKNGTTTNSTSLDFTVDAASLPGAGEVSSSAASFDMENGTPGWTSTGQWHAAVVNRLNGSGVAPTKAWIFNNGTNYSGTIRGGDLTSPPIRIANGGAYFLRFKFYGDIEGAPYDGQTYGESFWDQRRVQVSVDNGAFTDLPGSPLTLDAQTEALWFWPSSPAVPLGTFAQGQLVRVRFNFNTIDTFRNSGLGWAVDEVSVSSTPPDVSCAETTRNDAFASASAITMGTPVTGAVICPAGDVDVYKFSAAGGQAVKIDLTAMQLSPVSSLDSFVDLLDSSGHVLLSNDDEIPGSVQDSLIVTTLTKSGVNDYYVRVRPWDHPGAGGPTYRYNLSVTSNSAIAPNAITMTKPTDPQRIPKAPFIVEANVQDHPSGGGIRQVDFYWHNADWTNPTWTKFTSDTTNSDGWWGIFNLTADTTGGAFYILATNCSGGSKGQVITNLKPDLTTPYSALHALPDRTNSTAVNLVWEASAPLNDLQHFEIQYKFNGSGWTDWGVQPPGIARSAWFVGQPGRYDFRIRAINAAGSMEEYPINSEASTTLDGACVDTTNDASPATAQILQQSTTSQQGLCQNDVDWIGFNAEQGQNLLILFQSLGGGAGVRVTLHNADNTVIALPGTSAPGPGQGVALNFQVATSGTYYLEIQSVDPAIYGNDVRYSVWVGDGHFLRMPLISR